MAGHNKWSKIKHKKAITDGKRSKEFSRYSALLTTESKRCGGDMNSVQLKSLIDKARSVNMPSLNINRAIQKGVGKEAEAITDILYELYGPGGVGILIEAQTDNKNRTTPEIRHILSKSGYELGSPGSVVWGFTKKSDTWTPNTTVLLNDNNTQSLTTLLQKISGHDDVYNIVTNKDENTSD